MPFYIKKCFISVFTHQEIFFLLANLLQIKLERIASLKLGLRLGWWRQRWWWWWWWKEGKSKKKSAQNGTLKRMILWKQGWLWWWTERYEYLRGSEYGCKIQYITDIPFCRLFLGAAPFPARKKKSGGEMKKFQICLSIGLVTHCQDYQNDDGDDKKWRCSK